MAGKIKKETNEHFEKHMHDGHRARLLESADDDGIYHFSTVQVLEFILCYIIPRGDVNPIAHRLLEKFRNLSSVMEASIGELVKVKGMGETSAKKLRAFLNVFDIYNVDKINNCASIENFSAFLEGIEMLLRSKNEEHCYIFGVTASGNISHGRLFSRGNASIVNFDLAEITNYVSKYKVKSLIFVHNHPDGSCIPSQIDRDTNNRLNEFLHLCGASLYDSIIVGKDGIYSAMADSVRTTFEKKVYLAENLAHSHKEKLEKQQK